MANALLTEYGVAIDPETLVTPADAAELQLEPNHPGRDDEAYVRRRRELFAICRRHRLRELGPPLLDYTPEETRIWREVAPRLEELHAAHAWSIYLRAKRDLAITTTAIPQLRPLSGRLRRATNMHLVPAEGALPYRTFYQYIARRGFPVTQFLRHGAHPEFTPEPDMIHDCLGHVPPLMNRDYAELLALIGTAAAAATRGDHVLALKRFSWYSIEFGLIEERGDLKVFGAGILSSTGEIPFAVASPEVTRRPFATNVVIETDYDPSRMQDHLFVAPSLAYLRRELAELLRRLGIAGAPPRRRRAPRDAGRAEHVDHGAEPRADFVG